jgi:2-dehydropantoate 2-reductase
MEKISRAALSGLGAVGAMYAAKIHEKNPEAIRIIANKDRIGRYTKNSVSVNGKSYSFNYADPEHGSPCDLVIVAVKQHHLETAMDEIEPFVGENTLIISLLNGISSEEILGNRFGDERIVHAFVLGTDSVRVGTSVTYSKPGEIVFGVGKDHPAAKRMEHVRDFFAASNISSRIPDDILREQWWKFMMNVGINQTSAILRAPYGTFQNFTEARAPMRAASQEVVDIAKKAEIHLKDSDIDAYIKVIDKLSPSGKTSMLQDVEAGRKTEVEIFSGAVISLGKEYGVPTPVNETLFNMIRTIERMNGHG